MERDMIVVGGGSAGAVLAIQFTEDSHSTVLPLEVGPIYQPRQFPAILAALPKRCQHSRRRAKKWRNVTVGLEHHDVIPNLLIQ
jgi:choline dehydrogenase-like flavoprotein